MSEQTLGDGKAGHPCPGPIVSSLGLPTQQYNGQLHPLLNSTIRGAIWYQGESNKGQDELYACRFGRMMDQWRAEWHAGTGGATDPNFPIGFVQIGPFTSGGLGPGGSTSADTFAIRMGQTADFGYAPNTKWPYSFMATAFDLANPPGAHCPSGCIHIFNKQAVGHRLAVAARSTVYGENRTALVYSGPRVAEVRASGSTAKITYSGPGVEGKGLALRSKYGFEVCYKANCSGVDVSGEPNMMNANSMKDEQMPISPVYVSADDGWLPANITYWTSKSVTIVAPAVAREQIRWVRYAHDDMPSLFFGTQVAVYNAEGLPATPGIFRASTD